MAIEFVIEFAVLAAATLIAAFAVFAEKSIFKSALALAATFFIVSISLLLLAQPVIAVIQLFVLVGGLSTYAIVAVASETKAHSYKINPKTMIATFIALFILLSYALLPGIASVNTSSSSAYTATGFALSSYGSAIYMVVIFMFSVAAGSIIIIKRYLKG